MNSQLYVDAIRSAAIKAGKEALKKALLQVAPFLFWGPLGAVMNLLITKSVEVMFDQAEMLIFFQYIDMRVDAQGRAFSKAALRNQLAQASGTAEEKAIAEKDLVEKFRALVILKN